MRRQTRLDRETLFADLGYEPHEGQLEIHRSRASRRIVACGVRWGKTKCAAMEAIASALEPAAHAVGWVVAPTYDLADRVFREMRRTALEKLRHRVLRIRESEKLLVLANMGGGQTEIRGKSADNPVSLLGEGLDFLVVDEASRLRPSVWQEHLSQRLVDKNGWALLISTPKGKGYFYDLFRRSREDDEYESWNFPSWTNPYLDRDLIESERKRVPERVFSQEYGAAFIEGAGAVFRNVRECAVISRWVEPEKKVRYVGGLDLARVEDYTVLVIMDYSGNVVAVDRFTRIDWTMQVSRIRTALKRWNDADVAVDSTGMGEPIYEALAQAGCNVTPYKFTASSKSALVNNLALALEQKTIQIPSIELWPEGIDELEGFEFTVTEQGNVRSGSPMGQHDDCVIALALAAWQIRQDPVPELFAFRA